MRFYIADNHFFHERMNTAMDKRGFESLEAMHDYMIDQWNSVVRKMMKLLFWVIFHSVKVKKQIKYFGN